MDDRTSGISLSRPVIPNRINNGKLPAQTREQPFLWDNDEPGKFPKQRLLMEDYFKKKQVWDIISGEVDEAYGPEPLFGVGLLPKDIPKNAKTAIKRSSRQAKKAAEIAALASDDEAMDTEGIKDSGPKKTPRFTQPEMSIGKSASPEDLLLTTDEDVYLKRLGTYEGRHDLWSRGLTRHKSLLVNANDAVDAVLGPRAKRTILDIRRRQGLHAAWEYLVEKFTPRQAYLGIQLIKGRWEKLVKKPTTTMIDFFGEFWEMWFEMKDVGREPDNLDSFDRIKTALLYDDKNWRDVWKGVFTEVLKEHDIDDIDFIHVLETELTNNDIERNLDSQVQDRYGTFSQHERESKAKATVTPIDKHKLVQPEAAMLVQEQKNDKIKAENIKDKIEPKPRQKVEDGDYSKFWCNNCKKQGHIAMQCKAMLEEAPKKVAVEETAAFCVQGEENWSDDDSDGGVYFDLYNLREIK